MRQQTLKLTVGVLAVLLVALTACAPGSQTRQSGGSQDSFSGETASAPAPAAAPPQASAPAAQRSASGGAAANTQQPSTVPSALDSGQRLIQKNANLTLLVDDITATVTAARTLAESYPDGFVVNASQREENGRPAATVSIRVPSERFDEALDKLKGLAVRVQNEQITSKDITEEFVDVDARLRNLKATEQRYLELLAQARTVEDILKVEAQLTNVRGQIEQLQGRLNFLARSAQTSTINLELRLPAAAQPTPPSDWSVQPVFRAAWNALLNTLQVLLSLLIFGVVFTPIWLPLALLVRWWRRRRRARRSAPPIVPAPPAPGAATPAAPPASA